PGTGKPLAVPIKFGAGDFVSAAQEDPFYENGPHHRSALNHHRPYSFVRRSAGGNAGADGARIWSAGERLQRAAQPGSPSGTSSAGCARAQRILVLLALPGRTFSRRSGIFALDGSSRFGTAARPAARDSALACNRRGRRLAAGNRIGFAGYVETFAALQHHGQSAHGTIPLHSFGSAG